jgi:hypothetical protein
MPTYNAITGLKRRAARRDLPRKKRCSLSSTVASRMYAEQAMEGYQYFILASQLHLFYFGMLFNLPNVDLQTDLQARTMARLLLVGASACLSSAIQLLILDSQLLDLDDDHEDDSGFNMPLQDITLDSYSNDDERDNKIRFKKKSIIAIINALNLPDIVPLYYAPPSVRYYKFKVETLVIYMLRKMSTGRTHSDLCDNEFGGSSARWAVGYKWILHKFDTTFAHLIGPRALEIWAPKFKEFAETIREYIQRDKERTDAAGNPTVRGMPLQVIGEGEFNVFSVVDCTVYEICRPGSGPASNNNGAGRRENWYIKQVSVLAMFFWYFGLHSLTYFVLPLPFDSAHSMMATTEPSKHVPRSLPFAYPME